MAARIAPFRGSRTARLPPSETEIEPLGAPALLRRPALRTLRIGFVPLTDCAPLLVAEELGLFDGVGLRVALSAETAWAALRDKLAFGALDAAHMLGPMPIALAAGLDGLRAQVTVAAGLGANGNTITLSRAPAPPRRSRPPASPRPCGAGAAALAGR